ncbi:hypothetical protein DY000_02023423 [Brassica cretica]|uniref:Retrotransposon gag domain-containing protein n=1 Tax=Brassica cretica TaxID=69181 RepID=A0ABQ7EII0_BRACR|nr:hypothetical protein DY000_02023423 [Brassica cretica]
MPRKFSFPSIKMYDGTGDPDDHIAQYKQRMLAVALPKESREATMCKGFGSTLIGPALQWYFNLPTRWSLRDPPASSGTPARLHSPLQPGESGGPQLQHPYCNFCLQERSTSRWGLYKELTMYPCKTMEDVLSRAWAQVKWEEDVASRAKAQPKQDQRSARSDRGDRDERSSQRGSKDSGSRNRGRFQYRPQEKEEGMSVKWPPKMKAPDSFRNPGLWCDFHRDHGHKTEDCISLRIKVNELLQKGHLREFLLEKSKAHLSKEAAGKSKGAAPASPPRQDRVIHVISGGSEVSGVSHASAKKSTCNAKHAAKKSTCNVKHGL